MRTLRACAAAAATVLALGACGDRGDPVAASSPPASAPVPAVLASMDCRADVRSRTVSCDKAALPPAVRGYVVVGGQNQYAKLVSSNVTYDGAQNFEFDATVQNLIAQAMGTADGTTPDADGVRVFFVLDPTATSGSGMITVANADGTATFTAAGQQFYQYADSLLGADHVLASSETSQAKHWVFQMPPSVGTFAFKVYVAAQVRYPNGWVELTGGAHQNAGDTQAFTAVVRKFTGELAPDQSVTWGTSDTGVATVDGTGGVTGVAPGAATITATASGLAGAAAGTAVVGVCPNLAVGGVYSASMPGAASVCLGAGSGGSAEYTYMPVNLSTSSSLPLTITATNVAAVTGPPSPNLIPAGGGLLSLNGTFSTSPSIELAALRRDAARLSSLAAGGRGRAAASRSVRGGAARASITTGVPAVGDLMDLNTAPGCSGAATLRTGRVRSVSEHLIVVSDTANPPGGFTTAQYDSIALEFDSIGWQVDVANFGAPTDSDGNGRVVAFFTRAVNELQPPASSQPTDFGYVERRDLFSNDPVSGCERSNMGEMIYMEVPDPTGTVNANVRTVSLVRGNATRTLGRELQHVINASRRLAAGNPFEEAWLEIALSDVAQELMFYRTAPGLAPRQNIVLSNLNTGPTAARRVAAFNTYANPEFSALRPFLQRPDTTGAFRTDTPNGLAFCGVAWAFLRYASDRVNGSEPAFWASLVNTPVTGKANVQAAIGASPDEWLGDFVTAMYADDNGFTMDAAYRTPSWNYRSVYAGLGSVPFGTLQLTSNVPLTRSYTFGGGTAFTRLAVPAGGYTDVTALSGGAVPGSPYTLRIVRTK